MWKTCKNGKKLRIICKNFGKKELFLSNKLLKYDRPFPCADRIWKKEKYFEYEKRKNVIRNYGKYFAYWVRVLSKKERMTNLRNITLEIYHNRSPFDLWSFA